MAEYIEREAAIVAIKNLYPGIPLANIRLQKWHEENKNFMECELAIERIPAADVVPVKHGRWKPHSKVEPPVFHCSVCGGSALHAFGKQCKSDYCPNCGARMDGDGE